MVRQKKRQIVSEMENKKGDRTMQIMNLTTLIYALMIISLICTVISMYQQAKKKREQEKEE